MTRPFLFSVCVALLAAGCATTPQSRLDAASPTAAKPVFNRQCVQSGSRIPLREGECRDLAGRSFSRSDLDGTGQLDPGAALQQLDPAIGK